MRTILTHTLPGIVQKYSTAQLHSENQVLKEQLKESENYIDTHLARYSMCVNIVLTLLQLFFKHLVLTVKLSCTILLYYTWQGVCQYSSHCPSVVP